MGNLPSVAEYKEPILMLLHYSLAFILMNTRLPLIGRGKAQDIFQSEECCIH